MQLSQYNRLYPTFPLPTFSINVSGSVLLGVFYILREALGLFSGQIAAGVLAGLGTGFCGTRVAVVDSFAEALRVCARERVQCLTKAEF